jgi:hypothetical protein
MDTFYLAVLSVASIVLILVLTYVGILMTSAQNKAVYPPSNSSCPDYWMSDSTGNCYIPSSTQSVNGNSVSLPKGKIPYGHNVEAGIVNFNDVGWTADGSINKCAWQKWANTNNITWDGVTNYNGC